MGRLPHLPPTQDVTAVDAAAKSPQEARLLAALFARTHGAMRYDLTCMHALLAAVGNPHARFRVVTVAGTNGKGSTSALLARALERAGVRCGLFTSPHLRSVCERIRVDGTPIALPRLLQSYGRLLAIEPTLPRPFSFFEACVAMACMAFAEDGVEVAVMEAGLGGRLDATNVFAPEQTLLGLLTPVDLDHQAILGQTAAAIAQEKAGLWRRGRPALSAPQAAEVADRCRAYASDHGIAFAMLPDACGEEVAGTLPATAAWPAFMRRNAALVAAAVQALAPMGVPVRLAHLAAACTDFVWPGRYHWWRPPTASGPRVLLDGGHNPAGCAALVQALRADPAVRGLRLHGVVAALRDKNLTAMLAALAPLLPDAALCDVHDARARGLESLREVGGGRQVFADVDAALAHYLARLGPNDAVVVTGSVVLVGEAMRALEARHFVDAKMHA